ncbi:Lrp/AsnC family transcriptional regulator [Kordiimonas gwangyangensis]|uniref:Lrp/AsnC family transcriptional regulator n=1 Tax=Kordiimonas gwangyangensis TaxID=288022 RepID=UPI0003624961|nr:Lrp/AsnC family transcriptional regulator [Kordiimonas gwangyangensis]
MAELDSFDLKILDLMQENSRQTAEVIGEKIGLSPAATQRRIKKLREEGTIKKEVAILCPNALGGRTTLIVQIICSCGGEATIETFKQQMLQVPEVQQCYYVTGSTDFILIMTVKDMKDFDRITRKWFFSNPSIGRFETIVAIDTFKEGFSIPLGQAAST